MEKIYKVLAICYEFLNGGFYDSLDDLEELDNIAYSLCKNKKEEDLAKYIDKLVRNTPTNDNLVYLIKESAEIRYMMSRSFHDANVYKTEGNYWALNFYLDLENSLNKPTALTNKIYVQFVKPKFPKNLFEDLSEAESINWLDSEIKFVGNFVYCRVFLDIKRKGSIQGYTFQVSCKDINFKEVL